MIDMAKLPIPAFVWRIAWFFVSVFMRTYFFVLHWSYLIYYNFRTYRSFITKPTDSLLTISATQAARMIATRKLTSYQLVDAYMRRIERVDRLINAVAIANFREAVNESRNVDFQILDMDDDELAEFVKDRPLFGVPFTIKDAFEVEEKIVTCGIWNLRNKRCTSTAEVVTRMKKAGGILLAITNVPEVCMWVETANTIYGRTNNPYDRRRMAGGSSGGEGALLGAAGSVIGIGSDIGGSIRMPCFFNGVFGLKPTPGVVPLDGVMPSVSGYKTQMLCVGPMCRYAADLPLLLKIMGGENADKLRLDDRVSLKKVKVYYMEGITGNPFIQPLDWEMKGALMKAVQYFEKKYDLVSHRMDLPFARHALEFFLTSMDVEGEPVMSEYMLCPKGTRGNADCTMALIRCLCGYRSAHTLPGAICGLVDGWPLMSEERKKDFYYKRDRMIREMTELLDDNGIFLFPSWPCTALFHGQALFAPINFAYTCLFNSLALPVVQVPMGLDRHRLPLGIQVVGAPGSDRLLIAVAKDLEEGFGGWVPAAHARA